MTDPLPPAFDVNVDSEGLLIDLNSLYEHLTRLQDSRMLARCAMRLARC